MASPEPAVRYKHVSLPTQQRRLRHLRLIAVRNISVGECDGNTSDISQLETFFTLHRNTKEEAFLTSEHIKGSLNPTWRSFNLESIQDSDRSGVPCTASKFCVVRIWRVVGGENKLSIEWLVYLDGLVYLGDKSQQERLQYPPNTILFGMLDGIYGCPNTRPVWDYSKSHILLDQATVRESYSTQTLLRIKTILRAIQQTQASVKKVKHSIEKKLHSSTGLDHKRTERELHLLKTYSMRRDLDWRLRAVRLEKELCETVQSENDVMEKRLEANYLKLQRDKADLHEKKKGYFNVREDLIKTGAQLVMRRKQLISELAFIYPIVEEPNHKDYTICGVRLPNSEDFLGQDETMIAVALGYTCHLVVMISHFLDIPMRYPMEHLGSRSIIRDHIIDKLTDKERNFPLYSKGKEKFQFNYGVYLLNKNIAQLRYYCALGTTDLRMTLPNLKSLLEFRLGVRFESTNAPILAGQHMAVPPNLCGPLKVTSDVLGQQQKNNASITTKSQTSGKTAGDLSVDCLDTVQHLDRDRTGSSDAMDGRMLREGCDRQSDLAPASPEADDGCEHLWGIAGDTSPEKDADNPFAARDEVGIEDEGMAVPAHSKGSAGVANISTSASPVIRTLDVISREKLMGSIANYDDLDVSSSEDSACATYASRFKMWPRDQVDVSLIDSQWSGEESEKVGGASSVAMTAATSTFKTKAMTSPSRATADAATADCNDLLTVADDWRKEATGERGPVTMGPFPRQRTDSSTDGEDSATFVIPKSRKPDEVAPLANSS